MDQQVVFLFRRRVPTTTRRHQGGKIKHRSIARVSSVSFHGDSTDGIGVTHALLRDIQKGFSRERYRGVGYYFAVLRHLGKCVVISRRRTGWLCSEGNNGALPRSQNWKGV